MKIRITASIREIREITPSYRIYPDINQTIGRIYLEIENPQDKTALINLLSDICDRQ